MQRGLNCTNLLGMRSIQSHGPDDTNNERVVKKSCNNDGQVHAKKESKVSFLYT